MVSAGEVLWTGEVPGGGLIGAAPSAFFGGRNDGRSGTGPGGVTGGANVLDAPGGSSVTVGAVAGVSSAGGSGTASVAL